MRAVIIEDSRTQAHRLRAILEARGFSVDIALDGERGVALCRERGGDVDLVLSDVVMPGIDGFEVCRRLKADPQLRRISVMLLTSSTDGRDVLRALAAGADNFVGKPYEEDDLCNRVARTLARRSGSGESLFVRFRDEVFRIDASREQMLEILASTLDDVSARTDKLREAEERYRFLAESIPQMTWTADARGHLDYANGLYLAYTGRTLPQLIATSFGDTHPDDRVATEAAWRDSVAKGTAYEISHRVRRGSDGIYRWFLTRALPMRDETGAVTRWFGTSTDIDVQKRTQDGLAFLETASAQLASSLDLETTLQNVTSLAVPTLADCCAVLLRDEQKNLRLVAITHRDPNEAARLRELLERPSSDPITGETRRPDLSQVLQDSGVTSSIYLPVIHGSGTTGALLLATTGARVFDATDRQLAEELARRTAVAIENARLFRLAQREREREEEANRAKDDFLAMVSHELRTPLNVITGWASLLLRGDAEPEVTAKGIATIERNAKAQGKLIEEILDVSRIITGKLTIESRVLDVHAIAELAIESLTPLAEAKRIALVCSLGEGPLLISGDPHRIQQIFSNLLSNALKFTPSGGSIDVRMSEAGGRAVFVVKDTGVGISPSFLPHVFERFRQADSSISRSTGGLGLGLAIVSHLVMLHGGSIEAASEGEGMGATFTARFPLADVAHLRDEAAEPSRERPKGALRGVEVLLVDDDDDSREVLAHVLTREGARVREAASAAQAMSELDAAMPDVLVSDIGMPGEDGYSLLAKVTAKVGERAPHSLALTAYAGAEDAARALRAGFTRHLAKPVDPEALIEAVTHLARASRPEPAQSAS